MFLIDVHSKDPIYIQIQEQITRFIQAGVLKPGDRLPSVRSLAQDNGINPNTVARAYTELESRGIVCNVPKKGVYVAEIRHLPPAQEKVNEAVNKMKSAGISRESLLEAVKTVYGGEEHD